MEFGVDNEVLRSFQQEVRNYLPVIQETVRNADVDGLGEAREIARTISSAASVLGLSDLRQAATELEKGLDGVDRSEDDAFLTAMACLEQFSLEEIEASAEDFDFSSPDLELWPEQDEAPAPQPAAPAETTDEIVSDELLEIYQAESAEHLGFVAQHLHELEQDLSRRDLVQEVRRSIHTLKGAAAMVGLRTTGNLAKKAQDYLDGVCEGAIELTPEVLKLVSNLATTLDKLARAGVPDEALKGRAAELRDQMSRQLESGAEDLSRLAEAVAPPPQPVQEQTAEPDASDAPADSIVSDELLEIYQTEAEEQLGLAGQYLRALEESSERREILQELRRSIHSLKGAAGMVGLHTAGTLAHRAEDLLDELYEGSLKLVPEVLQLLFETTDVLQDLSQAGLPGEYLRARAKELEAAFASLTAAEAAVEAPAGSTPEPEQGLEPPPPEAASVEEAPDVQAAAEETDEQDEIISEEMLEVFQDEAEEHLGLVAQNLRKLESDSANREVIQEVRRSVHTLKGAAGMVGLRTAQKLSHRAEDYLDELFEGSRTLASDALKLLFETSDALDDLAKAGIPSQALRDRARGLRDRFGALLAQPQTEAAVEEDAISAPAEPDEPVVEERTAAEPASPAPAAPEPIAAEPSATEPAVAKQPPESAPAEPPPAAPLELPAPVGLPAAAAPAPAEAPRPAAARTLRPKPPARVGKSMPAVAETAASGQFVRVPLERVDELVKLVSELVVHRSTLEQQYSRYSRELGEHDLTTVRLRCLAVRLEDDFAARALLAVQSTSSAGSGRTAPVAPHPVQGHAGEFDELEFDRYSEFHLLSRDVTETASDLVSAGVQLRSVGEDFRQALHRFGRVTGQVQDLLMRMRMMPVSSIENRLHRTVRVAANRRNKDVKFVVLGADVELDKTMLGEITGPLEHILRNAVDHGLEAPTDREKLGKPRQGAVTLEAALDGHRAVLKISDNGRGLDPARIRTRAIEMGRYSSAQADEMSDAEVFELIFQPGFTTAEEVSEISGRGVGLDAVRAAVAGLAGSISIESEIGKGTTFVIGLPTSLAVTRVLLIESAGRRFCIPAHAVDKVTRGAIVPPEDGERRAWVEVDGRRLPAYRLADALHLSAEPANDKEQSILVVEAGERRYGLAVEQVMEARDAVVKSLGPLLENTPGISSATVLGDGSVALILNPAELPGAAARITAAGGGARRAPEAGLHVLMADDSISVRRVLMKTFEAAGWRYTAARDGQDALDKLRDLDRPPDVALLDVEMPRMDGFQLTTALRGMSEYANLPIVMLTSRAGEKHRRKAAELGANDYLVKPYLEDVLLSALRRAARAGKQAA